MEQKHPTNGCGRLWDVGKCLHRAGCALSGSIVHRPPRVFRSPRKPSRKLSIPPVRYAQRATSLRLSDEPGSGADESHRASARSYGWFSLGVAVGYGRPLWRSLATSRPCCWSELHLIALSVVRPSPCDTDRQSEHIPERSTRRCMDCASR